MSTMNKISKRIDWVDLGKCICAIFVIINHLESNTSLLGKFYEPFLLNGFLFLSGYTFKYRPEFKDFLSRKIKQLLVPWFFFGILIVISGNIYSPSPEAHSGLISDFMWFFVQIREKNDAMWFVSALFVAYIPFYFLIQFYEKNKTNKFAASLLVFLTAALYYFGMVYEQRFPKHFFPWNNNKLPWHIEYIPNALFFMSLGYLYKDKAEKVLNRYTSWVSTAFLFVLYLFLVYGNIWILFDAHTETRIVFWIIRQITAVASLVALVKRIKPNRIVLYIGQNSLIYFGIAHYLNITLQLLLKLLVPAFYSTILSNELYSAAFSVFFAIISALLLIIPAYIINQYFPFLVGRSRHNKK